jgi:hypothetical protein
MELDGCAGKLLRALIVQAQGGLGDLVDAADTFFGEFKQVLF